MSDSELLTAVLHELGWIKTQSSKNKYTGLNVARWKRPDNTEVWEHDYPILTSRDAVWEVLGLKDAPDIYWELLTRKGNTVIDALKATPTQLLEAWLTWKKGTK